MITVLAAAETPRQEVLAEGLRAADWITAGVILALGIAASAALRTVVGRSLKRGDSERSAADILTEGLGWLVVAAALIWSLSLLGLRVGPLFCALGIGGSGRRLRRPEHPRSTSSLASSSRSGGRFGGATRCPPTTARAPSRASTTHRRLRTYDGERVMVPCADVLSRPIVNHTTLGRRRTTLEVGVAFGTDLDKARKLLLERVQRTDGVLERPPTEVWVKEFAESAITLAVRYWHPPDITSLWRVRSHVAVAVKTAPHEAGIETPFPRRIIGFVPEDVPREPGQGEQRSTEADTDAGVDGDPRQSSSSLSAKGTSG